MLAVLCRTLLPEWVSRSRAVLPRVAQRHFKPPSIAFSVRMAAFSMTQTSSATFACAAQFGQSGARTRGRSKALPEIF
jgi:hypothetical protein